MFLTKHLQQPIVNTIETKIKDSIQSQCCTWEKWYKINHHVTWIRKAFESIKYMYSIHASYFLHFIITHVSHVYSFTWKTHDYICITCVAWNVSHVCDTHVKHMRGIFTSVDACCFLSDLVTERRKYV